MWFFTFDMKAISQRFINSSGYLLVGDIQCFGTAKKPSVYISNQKAESFLTLPSSLLSLALFIDILIKAQVSFFNTSAVGNR